LVAILVGSRGHRTQCWKGAIQGPFHQRLVAIGPVVSEEKIKMWNVDERTTDDRRRTKSDDNSSHGLLAMWAKKKKGMISSTCDIYKKKLNSYIQKKINQNKLYTKNIKLWYTLIYNKK
jgi:hypothetical protein